MLGAFWTRSDSRTARTVEERESERDRPIRDTTPRETPSDTGDNSPAQESSEPRPDRAAGTPFLHSSDAAITLEGVTKSYPGQARPAVDHVSMEIAGAQVTVLIGPSGSGKTTILKMINRLVEPTEGRILIGGEDIQSLQEHRLRRSIGYVIQQVGLFPHWSIERNVATVPRLLGWDRKRIRTLVGELLELVGLDSSVAKRYPSQLSGGQQQRVGVARALAGDPPILLMDEPFASVDPIVREHLQDELLRIQERVQKTIVFVTHDMDEAFKLGDRIAILDDKGQLHQVGSREDLLARPADDFVDEFLGRERGLRVLSVLDISGIDLLDVPRVEGGTNVHDARKVMQESDHARFVVTDGDRVVGLVEADELREAACVRDLVTDGAAATILESATLREALDYLLRVRRSALPVFDGDNYQGVITLEQIRDAIPK